MKLNGANVQKVLEESNAKIASLTAKLEDAEQAKADAEKERDELKEECGKLQKELDEKPETIEAGKQPEETPKSVEAVKADETPSVPANTKTVDTTNLGSFTAGVKPADDLAKYRDIADTPEELNEVLVNVQETLRKCEADAEELEKLRKENEDLKADLKDKDDDIKAAECTIESYTKLGTIQELSAMIESAKKIRKEARQQKLKEFIEHYSNKKGITQESVRRIMNSSKSVKSARAILESLPNKDVNKGLYRRVETAAQQPASAPLRTSFAESYIKTAEASRTKRYTV